MRTILFQNLFRRPLTESPSFDEDGKLEMLGDRLRRTIGQQLGRSLSIRAVDAGSCNGCELEMHALGNAYYDLERFGIHFVASPRHADLLMVTGPVTHNMREALQRTYEAMPNPKWVISAGDCARDGGVFANSYAVVGGVDSVIPVDGHVPGCPPTPLQLLQGLYSLLKPVASEQVPER